MGLDNGIAIKMNKNISKDVEDILKYFEDPFGEVCYWRKCWNIRNKILESLNDKYELWDEYEYFLDEEDIQEIIKILTSFNKENWICGNAFSDGSIWEWDEIKDNLKSSLNNLYYLLGIIKTYNANNMEVPFQIYFYDSY